MPTARDRLFPAFFAGFGVTGEAEARIATPFASEESGHVVGQYRSFQRSCERAWH